MSITNQVSAGTVMVFTAGAYSDFNVEGVFVATEDFEWTYKSFKDRWMLKKDFLELRSAGILLELETTDIWVDR